MPCAYCREQGHNRSTCPHLTGLEDSDRVSLINERNNRERMERYQRQRQMEIEAARRRRRMREQERERQLRRQAWTHNNLSILISHYNETADFESLLNSSFESEDQMLSVLGPNELSQAMLNNYYAIKSSKKELVCQVDNPVEVEDCPICMDSLQKTDLVVTRCGHSFHSSCLFKHLSKHDNCPYCRGIIV